MFCPVHCLNPFEWLLQLLTAIEMGEICWPQSLMQARVVMLAKTAEPPTGPLQVRPITITSRIYRTWSRYRSMQISKHLQSMLPPEISATAAGVSADQLAASIMCEVEESHYIDEPKYGMTLDLVKCYNRIPRQPILMAMQAMGIPLPYLTALESMFMQLERILQISSQVGSPARSTSGVPEGCCFSTICMLSLTAWITKILQDSQPDATCVAYADNWEVIAQELHVLRNAVTMLWDFIHELQMEIAPDKSWTWATHAEARKALREMRIHDQTIPVRLVATDLGCDVTYCHRISKVTSKKRLAKAKRVLARVAQRRVPMPFRKKMTNQLSQSVSGYGSELVYIPKSAFKSIRAACCKSIGKARGGANPHLAMHVSGLTRDPQISLALRKCFFWRRFFTKFPAYRRPFLERLATPTAKLRAGPAAAFRRTMLDLGWACLESGSIQHSRGWKFNWVHCSRRFLCRMLEHAWSRHVCNMAKSRKMFDITQVDFAGVRQAIAKLSDEQIAAAENLFSGKHVTNDALVHYSKGADSPCCPMCEMTDSRFHRMCECSALAAIREKYPGVLQWFRGKPKATSVYGLLPFDDHWLKSRCTEATVTFFVECRADVNKPRVDVFTDGSASYVDNFSMTHAAGAYVIHDGGVKTLQHAEMLPGCDHIPFRAEAWAILLAMRDVYTLDLYTDCQAALLVCEQMIRCRHTGQQPRFRDHHDVWDAVWRLMLTRPVGCVRFFKVTAHQDPSFLGDPALQFRSRMNNKVDAVAKQCVKSFLRGKLRLMDAEEQAREKDIKMLSNALSMWHELNATTLTKIRKDTTCSGLMPAFVIPFSPENSAICQCDISDDVCDQCPFGATFARRVRAYFHMLPWDCSQAPVSALEVYIDYCLFTGSVVPVRVDDATDPSTKEQFALPDLDISADSFQVPLVTQSRTWVRMIKWILARWPNAPMAPKQRLKSLAMVGYLMPAFSLSGYPKFRSGILPRQHLWQFFHANGKVHQSLGRMWKPPRSAVPMQVAQAGA